MKQSDKKVAPEFKKLGEMLVIKRGTSGIRSVAEEVGVSAATLSRIERGYTADDATLKKVCDWLGVELSEILEGGEVQSKSAVKSARALVHFRKDQAVAPKTANALAQLILAAQDQMSAQL